MACFGIEGRAPVQSETASSLCGFMLSRHTQLQADMTNGRFQTQNPTTSPWFGKKLSAGLWINWGSHLHYRDELQEGLLMWDSHYLMANFMLISWTDQSVSSGYASLDELQDFLPVDISYLLLFFWDSETLHSSFCSHKFPLGINSVARGFEVCVLTRPITVWQPLVRVHKGIHIVTSVLWKDMSKNYRKHFFELLFWLLK